MIIECPACTTRYDIKATLPPEGRTVRCAKCGTVWRATPEPVEEPSPALAAETPRVSEDEASAHRAELESRELEAEKLRALVAQAARQRAEHLASAAASADAEESHPHADSESAGKLHADDGPSDVQHGDDARQDEDAAEAAQQAPFAERWRDDEPDFRAANEAEAEPAPAPAADDHPAHRQQDHQPQAAQPRAASETPAQDGEDGGERIAQREDAKVSWFGSFRRRRKAKDTAEPTDAAEPAASPQIAETIPFPRQPHAAEAEAAQTAEPELRTLQEAREAVRSVFSSLGEGRAPAAGRSFASPITTALGDRASEDQSAEAGVLARSEAASADTAERAVNNLLDARQGDQHAPHGGHAWRAPEDEAEDSQNASSEAHRPAPFDSSLWAAAPQRAPATEGDPEDALRAAMRSHFSDASEDKDLAEELESHLRAAAEPHAEARAGDDMTGDLAAIWKRPQARPSVVAAADAPAPGEDSVDASGDDATFDPRLAREIEETQVSSGHPRRGFGSLAVAAGWGLFVTVAAGLVVGLLAFRDIVADTAPGLAPLYSSLGMPVTVQPLSFDAVTYKWTITDGKPTLLVSGAIYNSSKRKVKMPDFTITIKDRDPALDREYSAALRSGATKIRSSQREDFDIELVSPSPTLSSIELALKKVR